MDITDLIAEYFNIIEELDNLNNEYNTEYKNKMEKINKLQNKKLKGNLSKIQKKKINIILNNYHVIECAAESIIMDIEHYECEKEKIITELKKYFSIKKIIKWWINKNNKNNI